MSKETAEVEFKDPKIKDMGDHFIVELLEPLRPALDGTLVEGDPSSLKIKKKIYVEDMEKATDDDSNKLEQTTNLIAALAGVTRTTVKRMEYVDHMRCDLVVSRILGKAVARALGKETP